MFSDCLCCFFFFVLIKYHSGLQVSKNWNPAATGTCAIPLELQDQLILNIPSYKLTCPTTTIGPKAISTTDKVTGSDKDYESTATSSAKNHNTTNIDRYGGTQKPTVIMTMLCTCTSQIWKKENNPI